MPIFDGESPMVYAVKSPIVRRCQGPWKTRGAWPMTRKAEVEQQLDRSENHGKIISISMEELDIENISILICIKIILDKNNRYGILCLYASYQFDIRFINTIVLILGNIL